MFGCEIGRDRGLPIALPYRRGGPRGRSRDSIAFNRLVWPLRVSVDSNKFRSLPGFISRTHGETDFYTPQVLGGAALLDNSAPVVYKIQGP